MNSKLDYAAFTRGVRNKAERQQQVDKFVFPDTEETKASRKERGGSSLTGGLSAGGQVFTRNLSRKKVVKGGFSVFLGKSLAILT